MASKKTRTTNNKPSILYNGRLYRIYIESYLYSILYHSISFLSILLSVACISISSSSLSILLSVTFKISVIRLLCTLFFYLNVMCSCCVVCFVSLSLSFCLTASVCVCKSKTRFTLFCIVTIVLSVLLFLQ